MNQKRNPSNTKTNNKEDMQKSRTAAAKKNQKGKEPENLYTKLEATFEPLSGNGEFDRFFTVREKLYNTRKDREETREKVYKMKHEFDELKNRLKGFIQEQVVSSSKIAVPRTQKAKTVTQ